MEGLIILIKCLIIGIVGVIFAAMSIGAVIFTAMSIGSYFCYKRGKKFKEARLKKGITLQMFFEYFLEKGVDHKLCKIVYEYFQEWENVPVWPLGKEIENFPVMPLDDIGKIYGIALETLDNAMLEILARYTNIPAKDIAIENLSEVEIQTIDDLVITLWKQLSSQQIKTKPAK
jgi:hypothetical protein